MHTIKIGCYSDIHHHEYSNGVTGADVEAVEDEFLALCQKEQVDFWVFCGDRFLSRNPQDISRRRADAALKKKAESGIPGIVLVGNHDRWTKSPHSEHNYYNISMYPNDLKGIHIMDEISQITLLAKNRAVNFYAIPAGHKAENAQFKINKNNLNICLFHDIVKGSVYTNGITAPEGVDPGYLDVPDFDIVLGGDNHQPQDLHFTNTTGYYIGAPMQHNWGDYGTKRGYLFLECPLNEPIITRYVESSAPKFLKEEVELKSDDDLTNFMKNLGTRWQNNIVRVTFAGKSNVLAGIQVPKLNDKLLAASKARLVHTSIEHQTMVVGAQSIGLQVSFGTPTAIVHPPTPDQEWREYINFKSADFAGLDVKRVEQIGIDLIIEADNG
jgi:DNA repair exonuclease SbcCD nuclease subunit